MIISLGVSIGRECYWDTAKCRLAAHRSSCLQRGGWSAGRSIDKTTSNYVLEGMVSNVELAAQCTPGASWVGSADAEFFSFSLSSSL